MYKKYFYYFSMAIFVLLLNFQFFEYNKVSQIFIVWVASLIPLYEGQFLVNLKKNKKIILYSTLWFIPLLFSAFYSEDIGYGFKQISKSILILIAPFVFFTLPQKHIHKLIKLTKIILPIGTIILFVFLFAKLCLYWHKGYVAHYGDNGMLEYIKFVYNHRFSYLLDGSKVKVSSQFFHKAYFGIFVLLSILLVQMWNAKKWLKISVQVTLFTLLILSKGRAQIIVGLFVALYIMYLHFNKNKKILIGLLLAATISSVFIIKNKNIYNKLTENTSVLSRVDVYTSAIEIFSESPIYGIGIGDVQKELNARYKEKDCVSCKEKGLNTHNYYLHILVSSGIIGLFVFLFCAYHVFKYAYRYAMEAFIFLVIIFFSLFFENLYVRMWGCVAYGIFANLLLSYKKKEKHENFIFH